MEIEQKFDYNFLYLLGLEDQFSVTDDIDTFQISLVWQIVLVFKREYNCD